MKANAIANAHLSVLKPASVGECFVTRVLPGDRLNRSRAQPPAMLVADGDHDLCELYQLFFSRHGWRVEVCGDGVECLEQLRQQTPQVLVLDLHLLWGGAGGLLAVMRDDPAWTEVPVIVTSTDALPDGSSDLMSRPVVQALGKPFSLTDLLKSALAQLPKN